MTRVIVLGGGIGGEREVSLDGARAVAEALRTHADLEVAYHEVGQLHAPDIEAFGPGVIFPVLHGVWGEGGPLQELLESLGRAFVGSRSVGARVAMDKAQTLERVRSMAIETPGHEAHDTLPQQSPIGLPAVIKPVADGSSVGVRICRDPSDWSDAVTGLADDPNARGPWLIEKFIEGREFTVALLEGRAMPIIEIVPNSGFYDYNAKYESDDTVYLLDPPINPIIAHAMAASAEAVFRGLNLRHLARADFVMDREDTPRFLEINTMPGFTSHSLVPKAAQAIGLEFSDLCRRLVDLATEDAIEPMFSG